MTLNICESGKNHKFYSEILEQFKKCCIASEGLQIGLSSGLVIGIIFGAGIKLRIWLVQDGKHSKIVDGACVKQQEDRQIQQP